MAPIMSVFMFLFVFLQLLCLCIGATNSIQENVDSTNSLLVRLDFLEQQTMKLSQRCTELEKHNQNLDQLLKEATRKISKLELQGDSQMKALSLMENVTKTVLSDKLQQMKDSSMENFVAKGNGRYIKATFDEFMSNRKVELAAFYTDSLPGGRTINVTDTGHDAVELRKVLHFLTDTDQKFANQMKHLERQVQTVMTSSNIKETEMLRRLMERITDVEDVIFATDDVITKSAIKAESRKSAFSVAATRSQIGKKGSITPIILDHVFLNKGGHFNTTNSTFICETPGYYYFTYTMRTYAGLYLAVNLVKNHEYVVTLYSDKDERNVMDSQSVMLELVPGDFIYLALGPSDEYAIYSDRNNLSTFSGFLLYKKS